MPRSIRALWRTARTWPLAAPFIARADRVWWARTIRRANIVDVAFASAQLGRAVSASQAVRAYVCGGFATGMSLNPLFCESTVRRQLPDEDRVPALYAYLVNDRRSMQVSPNWDAVSYEAQHPDAGSDPAGALGDAWRSASRRGAIALGFGSRLREVSWKVVHSSAIQAAAETRLPADRVRRASEADFPRRRGVAFVCLVDTSEASPDVALRLATEASEVFQRRTIVAVVRAVPGRGGRNGADVWTQASLMTLWHPGVEVEWEGTEVAKSVAARLTAEAEHDAVEVVVVRGPAEDLSIEHLATLAQWGAQAPTAPLWLAPDGTVASAGVIAHQQRRSHLLAGFPIEDALRLGESIAVLEPAPMTLARPARDHAGPHRTLVTTTVTGPPADADGSPLQVPDTDLATLLAPTGFTIAGWREGAPALVRRPRQVTLADGTRVAGLRWAIKTAAPAGPVGESWGDRHFARGIASALRRLGQEVVLDAYPARDRPSGHLDDVALVLRGPQPIVPRRADRSILWVISHPDEILREEVCAFDVVFAASNSWAGRASARFGREITPLLQCTDVHRFRPAHLARTAEIFFVGTARGIARPSVVEPIRAGVPVSVYGPDWRTFIPPEFVTATGIPNERLPALYESAAVVLNDHWPAMQADGFVSNRLYDVVASGGRAISDHVDGIAGLFEGAVRTYRTVDELIRMLSGPLEELFPADAELARISAVVRERDSFDARARTLLVAATG